MQSPALPRRSLGIIAILSMVLTFIVGTQTPAAAATFTVDTAADTVDDDLDDDLCEDATGACSLRAAIMQANETDGVDTITFDGDTDPTLTIPRDVTGPDDDSDASEGDLDITEGVMIVGADDGDGTTITASAALLDRVFHVTAGPVTVSDVTVTGGDVTGGGAAGAGGAFEVAVPDDGFTALTATNVNLTDNTAATNGGAVHVSAGDTSFTGGTVSGNEATEGGGLWNNAMWTMSVTDTTFTDNVANGTEGAAGDDPAAGNGGGALFNNGGDLDVDGVVVRNNTATEGSGSGGGLMSVGADATTDVTDSTFANNDAARAGGGIELTGGGDLTVADTDFTGNSTGASPGNGGAIHITAGDSSITDGRVTGNSASAEGGGFWNNAGWTMDVDGTFFAGNNAEGDAADNGGGALFNNGGELVVDGVELNGNSATGSSGSGGGVLSDGGDLTVTDSMLDDNDANRAGGGIEGTNGAAITVTDTDFFDNSTGSAPGNGGAVHLSGDATLDITDGIVSGNSAAREGGGLWNNTATMTVDGTTVTNNTASGDAADDGGGGIFNNGGTLSVTGATITGNSADGDSGSGGGIQAITGGTVTVTDTTIEGNDANRAGGGIETNGPVTGTITTSTLSGNDTGDSPGNGGGLHITGDSDVDIDRSTVVDNSATNEGGGVWNSGSGTLAVTNSTITGNSTDGLGSQAFSVGTDTALSFTTLADFGDDCGSATSDDSDDDSGDANCTDDAAAVDTADDGSITLDNSIVATGGDDACAGTIDSDGGNVVSDDTCDLDGSGDQESADADLEALAANGGPTLTHALGDDSDAIAAAVGDCPATDQRGEDRPDDDCDSGAYEVDPADQPVDGNRFVDDDDSIFEDEIEQLAGADITRGCNPPTNDRFCPEDNVTREQMAAFLTRALDLTDAMEMFDDVDAGNIFAEDIGALANSDITRGCNPPENDQFCPDDFVTREQMAAFLRRGLDLPAGEEMFDDVSSDSIFAEDIGAIADAGITFGCNPPENDEFCPDDFVTREQMAAFLVRAGLA